VNNTDYVYLGVGITPSHPATVILAHELIHDPAQEGINILYNDGHVEWHAMPSALQEIAKQPELRKRK
jgi:prepilin-type processing-associated H-X9-DG protein